MSSLERFKRMKQNELIKKHLKEKGTITSMEAFELYGCTRLSARIFNLRQSGMNIVNDLTKGKNRYGDTVYFSTYRLVQNDGNISN